jgi:hypothetical protein
MIDRLGAELEARIETLSVQLNARMDKVAADLKADLVKWMFLFWTGTVLAAWLTR